MKDSSEGFGDQGLRITTWDDGSGIRYKGLGVRVWGLGCAILALLAADQRRELVVEKSLDLRFGVRDLEVTVSG